MKICLFIDVLGNTFTLFCTCTRFLARLLAPPNPHLLIQREHFCNNIRWLINKLCEHVEDSEDLETHSAAKYPGHTVSDDTFIQ